MGKVQRNIIYLTISLGKAFMVVIWRFCFGIKLAIIPAQQQLQVKCVIE
jgi:hypothetical protein